MLAPYMAPLVEINLFVSFIVLVINKNAYPHKNAPDALLGEGWDAPQNNKYIYCDCLKGWQVRITGSGCRNPGSTNRNQGKAKG